MEILDDVSQCKLTLTDGTTPPVELAMFYSQLDGALWTKRREQL